MGRKFPVFIKHANVTRKKVLFDLGNITQNRKEGSGRDTLGCNEIICCHWAKKIFQINTYNKSLHYTNFSKMHITNNNPINTADHQNEFFVEKVAGLVAFLPKGFEEASRKDPVIQWFVMANS